MKMIISPAKTLNFISSLPVKENSQPICQKEVAQIHKVLEELSPKELSKKMNISMSLAQLNWERNEDFSLPHTVENARQAIFAYAGTVYENLDAYSLKKEEIEQLQSSLRILSGLYGLLKPLDLIAPYRLEMNVKLLVGKSRNLYDFWKKKITLALKEELHEGELFVKDVFLAGYSLKNLSISVKDGMIEDYTCENFDNRDDNRRLVEDSILKGHKSLPMGEFAIGTNVIAYNVAKKYNIFEKMPILIAEKMGPHFAFGDTCYSHDEESVTYNPDGKAIIARDNECSIKRKTDIKNIRQLVLTFIEIVV